MVNDVNDNLTKSLGLIREYAPKLNSVTDEASAMVSRIEKFLNDECSVGIPASVPMEADGQAESVDVVDEGYTSATRYHALVYDRVDGKFRIAVETTLFQEEANGRLVDLEKREDIIAWSACPRHMKLDAFQKLPALVDAIAQNVSEVQDRTKETAAVVSRLLDAIEGK